MGLAMNTMVLGAADCAAGSDVGGQGGGECRPVADFP